MSRELTVRQKARADSLFNAFAAGCATMPRPRRANRLATHSETIAAKAQCLTDQWAMIKVSLMNQFEMGSDELDSYFYQYKSKFINDLIGDPELPQRRASGTQRRSRTRGTQRRSQSGGTRRRRRSHARGTQRRRQMRNKSKAL